MVGVNLNSIGNPGRSSLSSAVEVASNWFHLPSLNGLLAIRYSNY